MRMRVEDAGKMRLRVEINTKRPLSALCDASEQIQGGRCLADAALLVEYRNDRHNRPLVYRTLLRAGARRAGWRAGALACSATAPRQVRLEARGPKARAPERTIVQSLFS